MYTVLGKIKESLRAYPKPNITGYTSRAVKHFSKADLGLEIVWTLLNGFSNLFLLPLTFRNNSATRMILTKDDAIFVLPLPNLNGRYPSGVLYYPILFVLLRR